MIEFILYMAKIAVKIAILGLLVGSLLGLLSLIQFPAPDYTLFSQMIGKGYAILSHWVPAFPAIWAFSLGMFQLILAILALRVTISIWHMKLSMLP